MEASNQTPLKKPTEGPWVILVVGVNGVGKTTSIGKLAARFLSEDKKVLLAAADTYRAAAIDQLQVWGERLGVDVIAHKQGSDPAAVAYDAVKAAIARNSDVLLIDTAGRLHSKNDLMKELQKIYKVIGKDLPGAPHESWLVVDATTGQNAVQQVKAFTEVASLTGLISTKLDGTAKGGVLIGISDTFKLPIRYVGVGEKATDLHEFKAADYVDSLF
jgi:fused signal recognition particle receptor